MDPVLVAAAFRDRRDADVPLEGASVGEAVSLLAEGGEEPRREDGARARKVVEESKVRKFGAARGDPVVESRDAGVERAELRQESGDDEEARLDDGSVGGQRLLGCDGVDAAVDDGGAANAVGVEEVDDGLAPGALSIEQGRPPLDERDEDVGLFVAKPVENLREIGLECVGQPVRETHAILNEVAPGLDETPERAHVRALATQASELLGMAAQELERDSGVGRIVLGPAGREGAAVLGEGAWVDGKDDEEVVLEEGGDDGALRQLEAHGDGATAETLAQGAVPMRR